MGNFTAFIFLISIGCFAGMLHQVLAAGKPGIYPPKRLLKKRAGSLGMGGAIFLFLGALLSLLN
ncbi:hypothetical protein [Mesobacillus zeae]|uniref:Uncharacterized protein n=1 Tax=Mesobacillus zeae TaxID=1917180 RepID=A0A398B4X6_9BACI|nr:hypothetical protein [Mesobacillus zeae]RID84621.1 hypothetical protein D1970_12075 [Mesobacillus zeae]